MPELSLLRKLSYCRKFRIWFKHAQKGQKPIPMAAHPEPTVTGA